MGTVYQKRQKTGSELLRFRFLVTRLDHSQDLLAAVLAGFQ